MTADVGLFFLCLCFLSLFGFFLCLRYSYNFLLLQLQLTAISDRPTAIGACLYPSSSYYYSY